MKVWTDLNAFKAKNPVVTIGSFDGVHLGHIQVLSQLKKIAKQVNGETVVITLFPHPAKVLHKKKQIKLLNTINEKTYLLEKQGINHLIIINFTLQFSQTPYYKFVEDTLIKKIGIHSFLIGYDNTIGKNKEGNYNQLSELAKKYDFNIEICKKVLINNKEISSTSIRNFISLGKIEKASELLGYNYTIQGKVVHGQKIGKQIGFPTANILPNEDKFIPANGVYAIKTTCNNKAFIGMLNIGLRPTINQTPPHPTIEVHIFDFNKQIYNQQLTIELLYKLRNEQKFDSINQLKKQLIADKEIIIKQLTKM